MSTQLRALAAVAVLGVTAGVLGYVVNSGGSAPPAAVVTITPSAEPSPTPATVEPIAHPTGPRDVIFRATRTYPPTDYRPRALVNEVVFLYGDGRLLINTGLDGGAAGWWQVWLTEAGVQAVLRRAVHDAALLDQPAVSDPGPGGSDCETCVEYAYVLQADGRSNEVRVLCSGCEADPTPARAALERLRKYVLRLGQAVFKPSEVLAWGAYQSDAIHVVATVEHSDSPPVAGKWPQGLATPFDGSVTYCGTEANTVRDFIDAHHAMFFDGRTLYATPYEYVRPDQGGWATCGLAEAPPRQQTAPPLPASIDYPADATHLVFGVTWPTGGNPYPAMLPTRMSNRIIAVYGDGTVIVRGSPPSEYLGAAGDVFDAIRLTPDGMRRLAGELARVEGLPEHYNPNCVDCGRPTLELDLGPSRWTSSPDWNVTEPLTAAQSETLYGAIGLLQAIERHLAPGDIASIEDYASGEIWVQAFSDVPGGPEAAPWPALLGSPGDYREPRLLCTDEAPAARAALLATGSAWTAMYWEGTRYAVRYRPAFPEEIQGCDNAG